MSGTQGSLDFGQAAASNARSLERRDLNATINGIRDGVARWRQAGYPGVTPATRILLQYWAGPTKENRVLFGQREAVETAIYLTEAAKHFDASKWRLELAAVNAEFNTGLPRIALKMATGSGKTVVMAMLIAWQTINKATSPRDARFAKRFLVVAPGITIRDRLQVLVPGSPGDYYHQRDLIPPQFQAALRLAQVVVINYHAFLPRDAKEIKGIARTTRQILLGGSGKPSTQLGDGVADDPFRETPDAVVARVLKGFNLNGSRRGLSSEVVVLNDEAHHCYRFRQPEPGERLTREQEAANKEAGVWFTGLQWVAKRLGVKQIYDLSATPYYLSGSGYGESLIFPWVVSDYSLMDAIEAGIVKVPRTPVDDDAADERVTYLRLWDHVGKQLPKRQSADARPGVWYPPAELEGALRSLYRSYEHAFTDWQTRLEPLGDPPPVFIVVANNTVVSKLVYEWIAGGPARDDAGNPVNGPDGLQLYRPGHLPLFANVAAGRAVPRPPTILIDSAQLESGEALSGEFRKDAAEEIEAFKREYRLRYPGADTDKLDDADLLRAVLNTVGKRGKLGEQIRCVVSVSMLTEGWDATNVTHILGIRAFGSQLLCEQVVGRGLRRRDWALNDDGRFSPEYANVYGIPFAFIPTDKPPPPNEPPAPSTHVFSVPGREQYRIQFPRVDGYRAELRQRHLTLNDDAPRTSVSPETVPTWNVTAGVAGQAERDDLGDATPIRPQTVAFQVAKRILDNQLRADALPGQKEAPTQPLLFPQVLAITQDYLSRLVDVSPGYDNALSLAEVQAKLADNIYRAVTYQRQRHMRLLPRLNPFQPVGDTAEVDFQTRKSTITTVKSEVSHVALDGAGGNTWEAELARAWEGIAEVAAYVKNDRLGFDIPYIYLGKAHRYMPDFIIRLAPQAGDQQRYLIVEVSGGRKSAHSPGPVTIKSATARDSWCTAVNNHGGFGVWGFVEFTQAGTMAHQLREAIRDLYTDPAILDANNRRRRDQTLLGDPDLLDPIVGQGAPHGL